MKIHCEPCSEQKDIIVIYVDEEPWREIHRYIFRKAPSFPESIQSMEELEEYFNLQEFKLAKNYALRKLTKRSYVSMELIRQLKKVLVTDDCVNHIIDKCVEYGFIDDNQWVQNFIRREVRSKHGTALIKQKLRQKGVDDELIESGFNSLDTEGEQREQITRLLRTRFRARNLLDFKEREKTIGALVRRGYEVNLIREVINSCVSE
ncbi:MAG: regulatory protein RecX [Chlamydiota bacterium]|nr:regulatory protein RecX [Chlamydiota bacterium]